MIITCGKCKTKYRIEDSTVSKTVFKARCLKCNHIFTVSKPEPRKDSGRSAAPKMGVVQNKKEIEYIDSNCKVITICNQKGGVAKTTTCMNLGASLAMMKKRILLIDFDIQSNLSNLLGYTDAKSFFEVIHSNDEGLSQYIVKTNHDFWLLPSNSKMALLSKKYLTDENFEYMLREKLNKIKHNFDYILIDTPPSGDFYTLNALLASDVAVIPAQCEYLSLNGISHIEGMISVIKEKTNHKIDYQVLVTMYEQQNTANNVILNKINEKYNGNMFKTIINKDQKVQESQIVHTPTILYSEDSKAGLQYQELAKEILAMLPLEQRKTEIKAYS